MRRRAPVPELALLLQLAEAAVLTPAALGDAVLAQAERERDAAHAARDAAEAARSRAEVARGWAEVAGHVARADVTLLGEEVAFLREQLRGARAYHTEFVEPQLAALHAECDALRQELAVLGEELQARVPGGLSPAVAGSYAGTLRAR